MPRTPAIVITVTHDIVAAETGMVVAAETGMVFLTPRATRDVAARAERFLYGGKYSTMKQ